MQIKQSRRRFLASAVGGGRRQRPWHASITRRRRPAGDHGNPDSETPGHLSGAAVRFRRTPARGGLHRYPLRGDAWRRPNVERLARGDIDFSMVFAPPLLISIDAGEPVIVLAGVHTGCFELFAHEPIRTFSDLKGRDVGIERLGSSNHVLVAIMAAHVGLDPHKDINWITGPRGDFMERFVAGKVDAFLATPPESLEMRARKVGRVILNSTEDRPWSQYFCCMLAGNTDFIRSHPVATKRVLRAVLKANDLCASDPQLVSRRLVEEGFAERYDYALQTLTELPYGSWREFDPEDSMRFYALRMHEVGFISSSPNQLIAEGTDWRFLNELKRELKA